MPDELTVFSSPTIKAIVQDMREILSQTRVAFLLGAGCSKCAGLPLMHDLTTSVLGHTALDSTTKEILEAVQSSFAGAPQANIEDFMSEIVDFLSIAERRARKGADGCTVAIGESERDVDVLQAALNQIKRAISDEIGIEGLEVSTHQRFISAIHGSLQAGKLDRAVNYFVLNYDTLIEDALGLERIPFRDGFSGAATGWWDPREFGGFSAGARVYKVHGSIDWCLLENDALPRRIRAGIKTTSDREHVLIYPAATKYQETQRDPFAQILHQMREGLCPTVGDELVLGIAGYSFGDAHIDLEIENALRRSEGRLTVAAFVADDTPTGKLKTWLDDINIRDQVRVYANKGFFHGTETNPHDAPLPWWRFEILARLLGGEA